MRQQDNLPKLITTILLIIILLQFSSSQIINPTADPAAPTTTETPEAPIEDEPSLPTAPTADSTSINPDDILSAAEKAAQEGLGKSTNDTNVETLGLADVFQKPTMFIFNIKDQDKITLEMFIVLIALFLCLLAIMFELVSIFSDKWTLKLLISFTLALIAAMLGTITNFATVLTKLSPETLLGKTTGTVMIIIGIIVVIILAIFIKDIIKGLRKNTKLERAERGGVYLGSLMKVAKRRYEKSKNS